MFTKSMTTGQLDRVCEVAKTDRTRFSGFSSIGRHFCALGFFVCCALETFLHALELRFTFTTKYMSTSHAPFCIISTTVEVDAPNTFAVQWFHRDLCLCATCCSTYHRRFFLKFSGSPPLRWIMNNSCVNINCIQSRFCVFRLTTNTSSFISNMLRSQWRVFKIMECVS